MPEEEESRQSSRSGLAADGYPTDAAVDAIKSAVDERITSEPVNLRRLRVHRRQGSSAASATDVTDKVERDSITSFLPDLAHERATSPLFKASAFAFRSFPLLIHLPRPSPPWVINVIIIISFPLLIHLPRPSPPWVINVIIIITLNQSHHHHQKTNHHQAHRQSD